MNLTAGARLRTSESAGYELNRRSLVHRVSVLTLFVIVSTLPTFAESVEKKWRLGLSLGGHTPQDDIQSDAANVLTLFNRDFTLEQVFRDPRDDSSVFGTLEIKPSGVGFGTVQYGITPTFVIEGSVGYAQTDLGEIEVQAQFDGIPIDENLGFNFKTFRIPAGEVDLIPIMVSGIVRFRPRANFNPYIGAGIGYQIVGFSPSAEFDQLSLDLDSSLGGQSSLTGTIGGNPSLGPPTQENITDLRGATVNVDDSFIYQLILGGEWTIKPKWALLLDMRYSFSSRSAKIGFNNSTDLGIAVPFLTDFIDSPAAQQQYGAVKITEGGLVDGGSLVPGVGAPAGTNCALPSQIRFCTFDVQAKDGELDTGFYYINGGELKYDSLWFSFGLRYTF